MRRSTWAFLLVLSGSRSVAAQQPVDMELMTYPEVAAALSAGKTTVLIYNGGTEQYRRISSW